MTKGVLFDVDGTLVDSNDGHALAFSEAFALHGLDVPFARIRPLIGMGGDKLIPELAPALDDRLAKRIDEKKGEIFRERYLGQVAPFAGAADLVRALHARGYRLGVASSASGEDLARLLALTGVAGLLTERVSSDEAEHSKPDPDVIQVARRKLGLAAADVVLVGDTPYDVAAASRAGVGSIAVRSGGWKDDALGGALAIYDDTRDLLDHLSTSPLTAAS